VGGGGGRRCKQSSTLRLPLVDAEGARMAAEITEPGENRRWRLPKKELSYESLLQDWGRCLF